MTGSWQEISDSSSINLHTSLQYITYRSCITSSKCAPNDLHSRNLITKNKPAYGAPELISAYKFDSKVRYLIDLRIGERVPTSIFFPKNPIWSHGSTVTITLCNRIQVFYSIIELGIEGFNPIIREYRDFLLQDHRLSSCFISSLFFSFVCAFCWV